MKSFHSAMDSSSSEEAVSHDFRPFFQVFKDGRIQRFDSPFVPPSTHPTTVVQSKDVVISAQPKISARLYLPKTASNHRKLPLLVYFHGGAFSSESAFSTLYHTHLNILVAAANVVAVSIEYRRAPEHVIPTCYHDCWAALKWIANRTDPWIDQYSDFERVILMGDSAGANIAHNIAIRVGIEGLRSGLKIARMVLVHPLFGNGKINHLWNYTCPDTSGPDDPRFNPMADPKLVARIGCGHVLVATAGKDHLRGVGLSYYKELRDGEWGGVVEHVETDDEKHVFHLFKVDSEKTRDLINVVSSFINQKNQNHFSYSSL